MWLIPNFMIKNHVFMALGQVFDFSLEYGWV